MCVCDREREKGGEPLHRDNGARHFDPYHCPVRIAAVDYRYWSGELEALGDELVAALALALPEQPHEAARRAWASSAGVRANLHYDTYHNTYFQVCFRGGIPVSSAL